MMVARFLYPFCYLQKSICWGSMTLWHKYSHEKGITPNIIIYKDFIGSESNQMGAKHFIIINFFSVNFFANLVVKVWTKCALRLCAMYIQEIGVSSQYNRIYTLLVIYFLPFGLSYLNMAKTTQNGNQVK